jgi:hypothetical protein
MNTSPKKFKVALRDAGDGSGACILPIPNAILTDFNWIDGSTLIIEKMSDGIVVVSIPSNGVEQLDAEVLALAEEAFGDSHKATNWLHREHRQLGMSPAAYLSNGNSKIEVIKILQSIMHGGAV